jgi:hypothetical protein
LDINIPKKQAGGVQDDQPFVVPDIAADIPVETTPWQAHATPATGRLYVDKDFTEGIAADIPVETAPWQAHATPATGLLNLDKDFPEGIATEIPVHTSPSQADATPTASPIYVDKDFQESVKSEIPVFITPTRPQDTASQGEATANDSQENVPNIPRPVQLNIRNQNLPSSLFQVPGWSLGNPALEPIPSQPLLQIMPTPDPSRSEPSQATPDIVPKGALPAQNVASEQTPEFKGSVTTVVNAGGLAVTVNVSVKVVKESYEEMPVPKKVIADHIVQLAKEAAESICQTVLMDYAGEDRPDGSGEPAANGRCTPIKDAMEKSSQVDGDDSTPVERPGTPYSDVQIISGVFSGGPVTPEKAEAGVPRTVPSPNVKSRPRR